MCGLCGVQWWRETQLRELVGASQQEVVKIRAERDQLTERVKAVDGEILRLNAALNELRANSVAKADLEAANEVNTKLKAQVMSASTALQRQTEAIQKANDIIQQTTTERDQLAKKANEITEKYNVLVKKVAETN